MKEYFIHNSWVWFFVFALLALVLEHPIVMGIAIAVFCIAIREERALDWTFGMEDDSGTQSTKAHEG